MSLLDRIINPKPYIEARWEKNRIKNEKNELERKRAQEHVKSKRKYHRFALGMKDGKPIFLHMHFFGGYAISYYWEVVLSRIYWETPPFSDGYSTTEKIDGEWHHTKIGANNDFNRIKDYYNMTEIDSYYSDSKIKEVLGIDIKDYW